MTLMTQMFAIRKSNRILTTDSLSVWNKKTSFFIVLRYFENALKAKELSNWKEHYNVQQIRSTLVINKEIEAGIL